MEVKRIKGYGLARKVGLEHGEVAFKGGNRRGHAADRRVRFIDPSPEDKNWIREASTIPRQEPSKFARLPAEERRAVTEACRPGLERLGYLL